MFAYNHQNKVDEPNDVETEDKSDQACNNLAFSESCYCTKNPSCDRNDCKNKTYHIAQTKII